MKAINASKMYCTVTMQVTYQVSWCYFKWCNSRKCSRYLTSTQFVSQGHCGSVFWTVNKTRKHKKIQYYKTIINNNYQQEKKMGRETKQVLKHRFEHIILHLTIFHRNHWPFWHSPNPEWQFSTMGFQNIQPSLNKTVKVTWD